MREKVRLTIEEAGDIQTGITAELEITYNKYTYKWEAENTGEGQTVRADGPSSIGAILAWLGKRLHADVEDRY